MLKLFIREYNLLTLLLPNTTCPVLANSVDPDRLASEEANWSGSALFVIKYVTFYQKPGSGNLLEIRSGRGILINSAWQELKISYFLFFTITFKA